MRALALVAFVALGGCVQTDFDPLTNPGPAPDGNGLGGDAWRDDDISCETDHDCLPGEACGDGVCQLVRCREDDVVSEPPLGDFVTLLRDRELVVADGTLIEGAYWIDGYAPKAGHVGYPGSWKAGDREVIDIAGGNLLGEAPERFAVATADSRAIVLPEADVAVDAGGVPVALAAGQLDEDGADELVVLFGSGAAVCDLDVPACAPVDAAGGKGIDVTVAQVDGEGPPEVVFLLEVAGDTVLEIWRPGMEAERAILDTKLHRIASGDLDGDGAEEIIGFRDDDFGFWAHASVHAYTLGADGALEMAQHEIHDSTVDLDAADLDGDGIAELLAIRSDGDLELLRPDERGFSSTFVTDLLVSDNPRRISLSDIDGDSLGGTLVDGPRLVSGPVVPAIVVQFPPHSSEYSDGLPSVLLGQTDQMAESLTDTVALTMGASVGVGGSLFDLFSASIQAGITKQISRSNTETTEVAVGERFIIEPNDARPGVQYGAVVVTGGCFHAYDYDVNGDPMVVLVPVGGNSGVWSTPRYNAMAEALGGLPTIEIDPVIGDPGSYPEAPVRLDGTEIPPDDLVFEDPPELYVSDLGHVGWWLTRKDSTTVTEATTTTISLDAELAAAGVKVGAHLGQSTGQAYALQIGEEVLFGGSVPPIPDLAETPEDEYALHAYGFSPYVYREHYTRADGSNAGYYVLAFTVAGEG